MPSSSSRAIRWNTEFVAEGIHPVFKVIGTGNDLETTVLFEQGKPHMVRNDGDDEMKIVCFFAPPTGLENYEMHEGVEFKEGK